MGTQAGTDQAESGIDTLQAVCALNGSGISTTKLVMIYLSQWMFSTMQRIWCSGMVFYACAIAMDDMLLLADTQNMHSVCLQRTSSATAKMAKQV